MDLHHTADGVEGAIAAGRHLKPQPFSSWLDLIRLLDQPIDGEVEPMRPDIETLTAINDRIGTAESNGDARELDFLLAPALAFRRASGACVDRQAFMAEVAPGQPRETRVESVDVLDANRAIVRCTVQVGVDDQRRAYDNLRVFVRVDGSWRLLGWANVECSG
jgi:hypothetical protein